MAHSRFAMRSSIITIIVMMNVVEAQSNKPPASNQLSPASLPDRPSWMFSFIWFIIVSLPSKLPHKYENYNFEQQSLNLFSFSFRFFDFDQNTQTRRCRILLAIRAVAQTHESNLTNVSFMSTDHRHRHRRHQHIINNSIVKLNTSSQTIDATDVNEKPTNKPTAQQLTWPTQCTGRVYGACMSVQLFVCRSLIPTP